MAFLEKLVSKINELMMWIAGSMIMIMGFTTTADVFCRSVLNKPIAWSFDLSCYLSAAAAFLAGGYGLLTERHVRVDVIYDKFSPQVKGILDVCTSFLFFLFCFVLIYMGFDTTLESLQSWAMTGTVLNIPLFIPQMMVPLGGLLLLLQGIFRLIKDFKIAIGHNSKEGSN